MTITYPLSLPAERKFSARNWRKVDVTADVPSPYTGQSTVVVYDGQWIEVTLTLIAMKRVDAQDWDGFLTSLMGHQGTFLLGDPHRPVPLGSAAWAPGTPLVNGASQTGNTLAIDGAPNSATNYLKRGDTFQVTCAGVARLHEVIADASSNGSGQLTLDIWPKLRASPADNAAIVFTNPKGTFHRMSNASDWQVGADGISKRSFDAKERLT